MKTFQVSVMAAAILLAAAGIGFGIAQAGGAHSEQPVLSFEDQEAFEGGASGCSYEESSPVLSFDDQENLARDSEFAASGENRPVLSFEDQETVHVAALDLRAASCAHR